MAYHTSGLGSWIGSTLRLIFLKLLSRKCQCCLIDNGTLIMSESQNNTEALILSFINYFKNFPSSSDLLNRKCQCCLIKSQQWITDHVYQPKNYWLETLILLSKNFPSFSSVLLNRKCQCCGLVLRQWNTDCVYEPNNYIILFTLSLRIYMYWYPVKGNIYVSTIHCA